jgi:hypothetical protein
VTVPPLDPTGRRDLRREQLARQIERARAALLARDNQVVPRALEGGPAASTKPPIGWTTVAPVHADAAGLDAGGLPRSPRFPPNPTAIGAITAAVVARILAPPAPKLHAADLDSARRSRRGAASAWSRASWMAGVHAAAGARRLGDPKQHTIAAVGQALAARHDQAIAGSTVPLDALAKACGLVRETVRRALRYLEATGLLDRINVMARRWIGGVKRLVRDANLYLLRPTPSEAPAELRAEAEATPVAVRQHGVIARCAAALGLRPRHGGLAAPAPHPSPP